MAALIISHVTKGMCAKSDIVLSLRLALAAEANVHPLPPTVASETFSELAVDFIREEIKACTNVGKLVAATSL
jgi:hypothetical protein